MCNRFSLTLIGCGKMGGSMLSAWLTRNILSRADVIEPFPLNPSLKLHELVHHHIDLKQKINSNILILATKPQTLAEAIKDIDVSPETLVLSIAAGQSLERLQSLFPKNQPIIRAMPNTPAAIGKGMTAIIANVHATSEQKNMAQTLLAATGKVIWIDDESQMDAITALSGSGPAYVFYLIESLSAAGENMGLAPDLAMTLARQTVIGSAALAEADPKSAAETLRKNVTSKGGTTEAALEILMDGRFQNLLNEALKAAEDRGKALNKQS